MGKRGGEEGGGGAAAKKESKDDWNAVQGLNRVNSLTRIPRFTRALSNNQKMEKVFHGVEAR